MKSTDITNIYMGDTQGQKLFLGDELVWPISGPTPPTPTGSTYTLNTVYHATRNPGPPVAYNWATILHKTYIQSAYNTDIFTKAELGNGTEIPVANTYNDFPTSGNNVVNYTFTGSTLTPNLFMQTDLVSIVIPSGVIEIQYDCFQGCNKLTAVTISDSVTTIGSEAFEQCVSLADITIPSGVTSIGVRVFSGCTGMQEMIFQGTTPPTLGSDGLGNLGFTFPIYVPDASVSTYRATYTNYAHRIFGISQRPLVIPATYNVTSTTSSTKIIDDGKYDLVSAKLANGTVVPIANTYTFSQTGDQTVYFSFSSTTLHQYCFWGCNQLKSIDLSGVTEIGGQAFQNCPLTTITIPSSVTSIGSAAFHNGSLGETLNEMIFEGTTPPTLGDATNSLGIYNQTTYPIYVPDSAVSTYQAAYTNYASRIVGISQRP